MLIPRRSDVIMSFNFHSPLSIIKVASGKAVKLTFKKFLISEPGQAGSSSCRKDYVEVNGKK